MILDAAERVARYQDAPGVLVIVARTRSVVDVRQLHDVTRCRAAALRLARLHQRLPAVRPLQLVLRVRRLHVVQDQPPRDVVDVKLAPPQVPFQRTQRALVVPPRRLRLAGDP